MAVALTGEQAALAAAIHDWARVHDPVATVRAAEGTGAQLPARFADLGLFGVALPPSVGGAGGAVTDLAAGLAAAASALVPGPLLSTALAGLLLGDGDVVEAIADGGARVAVLLEAPCVDGFLQGSSGAVPGADAGAWLLVPVPSGHVLLPPGAAGVCVEPLAPFDFSRPLARVHFDRVPVADVLELPDVSDFAATLAVGEAAGVARWCLTTAVEYARVREQFGQVIGAFQAVKHLCAEMLCRAEAAEALAWDAATAAFGSQHAVAVASAAAVALDAAVDNAKDCVQVLGGIGFTWEHPAHLYLRRALALRHWLGGSARWRQRAADLALAGQRHTLDVVVDDSPELTRLVAEIAALPEDGRRVALAAAGLLAPHWPAPFGRDAGAAEQLRIDAALAEAGVRRPDLVIGAWAVPTILEHGTDEQRARFTGPTLRGELTWCQLFSEPGAGSDLASLRTAARRVDGGWCLNGQKVWTSLAHEADWAICLARTDPDAPKHKGITYFLVDMRSPGITTRPLREITGASVFNEVFLDDVFVPDTDVVASPGDGWRLARTTLAGERVALGKGSAAGEGVEALVGGLIGLGSALGSSTRERLGALIGSGSACSVLDLRATLRRLDGQGPGAESSVAKLLGVRHRQSVAEFALDLAPDLLPDSPQSHEFLLTRCLSIAGGTTQVLLSAVAERVLGLPR
ncbi:MULTISPECIES: acyl-CoA dehydrogenase [unclassified Amycolatopsis]|uniref:acyl-CoA dehydrogenase n=1 Tax=unclassified Amycolatopsis TaxID=2618356 RepID=UPI001C69F3FB|nr:acyl-CoA dehydrogenase [Amycolatopsis sp. DSM 110486]QYN17164.1 acyl-CoA dehydrogenase [Amycolatopsis sp. DSM 110486]